MNEQLQAALADLLGKANSGIDAGATFLQAQLPDVIQQLLVWKMADSSVTAILSIAFFIGSLLILRKTLPPFMLHMKGYSLYMNNNRNELEEEGRRLMNENAGCFWLALPSITLTIISLIVVAAKVPSGISVILKIWLAPKIYLIEYAASLAK